MLLQPNKGMLNGHQMQQQQKPQQHCVLQMAGQAENWEQPPLKQPRQPPSFKVSTLQQLQQKQPVQQQRHSQQPSVAWGKQPSLQHLLAEIEGVAEVEEGLTAHDYGDNRLQPPPTAMGAPVRSVTDYAPLVHMKSPASVAVHGQQGPGRATGPGHADTSTEGVGSGSSVKQHQQQSMVNTSSKHLGIKSCQLPQQRLHNAHLAECHGLQQPPRNHCQQQQQQLDACAGTEFAGLQGGQQHCSMHIGGSSSNWTLAPPEPDATSPHALTGPSRRQPLDDGSTGSGMQATHAAAAVAASGEGTRVAQRDVDELSADVVAAIFGSQMGAITKQCDMTTAALVQAPQQRQQQQQVKRGPSTASIFTTQQDGSNASSSAPVGWNAAKRAKNALCDTGWTVDQQQQHPQQQHQVLTALQVKGGHQQQQQGSSRPPTAALRANVFSRGTFTYKGVSSAVAAGTGASNAVSLLDDLVGDSLGDFFTD
jgi:hypothetical protein